MTDEELRTALGPLPTAHVPEDAWVAWAAGELSPAEASRLLAHASTCPECARVRRVVQELRDGARPATRRPWVLGGGAIFALAAAALLAVALWPDPAGPDVVRGDGWTAEARVEGALRISAPPVAGADTYRLTVWGPGDAVVHTEAGPRPEFSWSAPPGRWRWRVEASSLGAVVASTPITPTEVQ